MRRKKGTWRRNKPPSQPERPVIHDDLLDECRKFVKEHNSLALDDTYDQERLAQAMAEFIGSLIPTVNLISEVRRRELEEEDENFEK